MSQPDLAAQLAAARPAAPAELRERVRLLAAAEPAPRRRLSWRAGLLVAGPALAAVVVLAVVLGRGGSSQQPTELVGAPGVTVQHGAAAGGVRGATPTHVFSAETQKTLAPLDIPVPRGRLVNENAFLALRVPNPDGVSSATRAALRIASSLGGYPASVHVDAHGRDADAQLRLKIPVRHVQQAIARLSQLGTIVGEDLALQDAQAGVNATDRLIARLQKQLADLRAQPQTEPVKRQIAAVTARIQQLQRGRAGTVRAAHFSTIELDLTTRKPVSPPRHHRHGPLHGAVTALKWVGIGAFYALVVGGPFALLLAAAWLVWRTLRRRAEARLLSES